MKFLLFQQISLNLTKKYHIFSLNQNQFCLRIYLFSISCLLFKTHFTSFSFTIAAYHQNIFALTSYPPLYRDLSRYYNFLTHLFPSTTHGYEFKFMLISMFILLYSLLMCHAQHKL